MTVNIKRKRKSWLSYYSMYYDYGEKRLFFVTTLSYIQSKLGFMLHVTEFLHKANLNVIFQPFPLCLVHLTHSEITLRKQDVFNISVISLDSTKFDVLLIEWAGLSPIWSYESRFEHFELPFHINDDRAGPLKSSLRITRHPVRGF